MTSRETHENNVQTGVRVPQSTLDRADKLADAMSQIGIRLTRTDILRSAILRGLDQLEAEGEKR